MDAYTRAIKLNPFISEVWYDLGTLYETCNNQTQDALDAYTRALELDPTNQNIKNRLNLLQTSVANGQSPPTDAAIPQEIQPGRYSTGQQTGGRPERLRVGMPPGMENSHLERPRFGMPLGMENLHSDRSRARIPSGVEGKTVGPPRKNSYLPRSDSPMQMQQHPGYNVSRQEISRANSPSRMLPPGAHSSAPSGYPSQQQGPTPSSSAQVSQKIPHHMPHLSHSPMNLPSHITQQHNTTLSSGSPVSTSHPHQTSVQTLTQQQKAHLQHQIPQQGSLHNYPITRSASPHNAPAGSLSPTVHPSKSSNPSTNISASSLPQTAAIAPPNSNDEERKRKFSLSGVVRINRMQPADNNDSIGTGKKDVRGGFSKGLPPPSASNLASVPHTTIDDNEADSKRHKPEN